MRVSPPIDRRNRSRSPQALDLCLIYGGNPSLLRQIKSEHAPQLTAEELHYIDLQVSGLRLGFEALGSIERFSPEYQCLLLSISKPEVIAAKPNFGDWDSEGYFYLAAWASEQENWQEALAFLRRAYESACQKKRTARMVLASNEYERIAARSSQPTVPLSALESRLISLMRQGLKSRKELALALYGEKIPLLYSENRLKVLLSRMRKRHPELLTLGGLRPSRSLDD